MSHEEQIAQLKDSLQRAQGDRDIYYMAIERATKELRQWGITPPTPHQIYGTLACLRAALELRTPALQVEEGKIL